MDINRRKVVIFGAGKVGRSFIGPVFARGGYEVVFIDKDENITTELNDRRSYKLVIRSNDFEETEVIDGVSAIHSSQESDVVNEIASSGLVAVSVGVQGLDSVITLLARGLKKRFIYSPGMPLDIIIAENLRDGASWFRNRLLKILLGDYPLDENIGLVETSIGKMVPVMEQKDLIIDKLQIFAEPYNTLIVDRKGFKGHVPEIADFAPKDNIKAWVDRKLFIHNLGHVSIAYAGYLYNNQFRYVWEALSIPEIRQYARKTMLQSAGMVLRKYPREFSLQELTRHIDDLLDRFGNRALGDTIYRVGCDLKRKLGANDRLAGAIRSCLELELPYGRILFALVCGCYFKAGAGFTGYVDNDADFFGRYGENVASVLEEVSGFNRQSRKELFSESLEISRKIKQGGFAGLLPV